MSYVKFRNQKNNKRFEKDKELNIDKENDSGSSPADF